MGSLRRCVRVTLGRDHDSTSIYGYCNRHKIKVDVSCQLSSPNTYRCYGQCVVAGLSGEVIISIRPYEENRHKKSMPMGPVPKVVASRKGLRLWLVRARQRVGFRR